jgi:hypothetical protein
LEEKLAQMDAAVRKAQKDAEDAREALKVHTPT